MMRPESAIGMAASRQRHDRAVNRGDDDRPEPSGRLRYVATMCVMLAVAVLVVRWPGSHATVVVAALSLPVVVWSFVKDLREIRRFRFRFRARDRGDE
jgi:Flp pilus assembly protein TadB